MKLNMRYMYVYMGQGLYKINNSLSTKYSYVYSKWLYRVLDQ